MKEFKKYFENNLNESNNNWFKKFTNTNSISTGTMYINLEVDSAGDNVLTIENSMDGTVMIHKDEIDDVIKQLEKMKKLL